MSLTYPEAIVIGALQGVAELFPVSSLGHSILIPALIGGDWAKDLDITKGDSPYLAFVVALHVATALALLLFFWRDWVRIIGGLFSSIRKRKAESSDERLAWLLIFATIPVGIAGLAFDKLLRTTLGAPTPAAIFLTLNGLVIFAGERLRRRGGFQRTPATAVAGWDPGTAETRSDIPVIRDAGPMPGQRYSGRHHRAGAAPIDPYGATRADIPAYPARQDQWQAQQHIPAQRGDEHAVAASIGHTDADANIASDARISRLGVRNGVLVGAAQILALFPGISRSGVTMIAGLYKGLSHEDAARFAFLLATPVILAAGLLKMPELLGPQGKGIHGQILVGSLLSFVGAYVSVRFLTKYFETRTLTPFAIYCAVFGLGSLVYLNV